MFNINIYFLHYYLCLGPKIEMIIFQGLTMLDMVFLLYPSGDRHEKNKVDLGSHPPSPSGSPSVDITC